MEKHRNKFSGKLGFILATASSAVGLGNIWRFPYLSAKYGGGTFLFVYIILSITFGFTLMITEIAIGRKTQLSTIGAYKALDKRFAFLGWLASAVPIIILPYYSVIGGWVMKYIGVFVTGGMGLASNDAFFGNFIAGTGEPILWFSIFLFFTALIVILGVKNGIEKASKIAMPILIILCVITSAYSLTIPGAMDGLLNYILPDFKEFSIMTVISAMGQLFYSMSIAMGILITYGSYMKKDVDIIKSAKWVELFDTGVAFLAGLMIVPAVFAFSGGDESAIKAGPGLMFVTLPKVFQSMGFAGNIIGTLFFILVLFAAITSGISLMETIVSILQDKFKLKRVPATIIVAGLTCLIGIPVSLGFGPLASVQILGLGLLDFFDTLSNSVLMPIVALITCVMVTFFVKTKTIKEEIELSAKFKSFKLYNIMIKYIAPIFLVLILVSSILNSFGFIKI